MKSRYSAFKYIKQYTHAQTNIRLLNVIKNIIGKYNLYMRLS